MALPARLQRSRSADPYELARNDFNTMLSRLFGGGAGPGTDPADTGGPLNALGGYGVDIREDADQIYVEADLPGFRKEDVSISLENGMLTIVAERREEIGAPGDDGGAQQGQPSGQPGQPSAQQAGQAGGGSEQQFRPQQQSSSPGAGGQPSQDSRQQGQRGQGSQPQGEYLLRERRIQRVVRSFTLPPGVDEQNVQARMENGVLTIVLNKREESKPRRVQIS